MRSDGQHFNDVLFKTKQTERSNEVYVCGLSDNIQLNIGITAERNKVFFGARFYCALLTLHVSAPFGFHLQVPRKHKKISKVVTIYSTNR
jgi:hypothetical protein